MGNIYRIAYIYYEPCVHVRYTPQWSRKIKRGGPTQPICLLTSNSYCLHYICLTLISSLLTIGGRALPPKILGGGGGGGGGIGPPVPTPMHLL